MSVTQSEFRNALGCFATGVTVITLDYENEVHGMTANAFTSVSLDPPLVLVCVDQRARTRVRQQESSRTERMRFGIYCELQTPPGKPHYDMTWEIMRQIEHADECGFDVYSVIDHHFFQNFSISANPLAMFAAAAQRTG